METPRGQFLSGVRQQSLSAITPLREEKSLNTSEFGTNTYTDRFTI